MVNLLSDLIVISCKLNSITFPLFSFHVYNENDQLEHVYLNSLLMKWWKMFGIMKQNKDVEHKNNDIHDNDIGLLCWVSFMLTVTYAECHILTPYAECLYTECLNAECRDDVVSE
jgi:hypothetical protein